MRGGWVTAGQNRHKAAQIPGNGEGSGSPSLAFQKKAAVDAPLDVLTADEGLFGDLIDAAAPAPLRDEPAPRRVGGSRAGRPNRLSVQFSQFYQASGLPHPVLAMGHLLRLGPSGIATAWGIDILDALKAYQRAAEIAAPYIARKQPLALEVSVEALPVMVLGDLDQATDDLLQARAEGSLSIDDDLVQGLQRYQQNQRVIAQHEDKSHNEGSQDASQPFDNAG